MRIVRTFIACAAVWVALAGAASAQVTPGRVLGGLQQAEQDHNQALEDAMNGNQPKPAAAGDVVPNGWMERKLADGTVVRLYVEHPAYAANATPHLPALIVVQEWWGVNEDMQKRTEDFAAKGYYAVAVDLFDGKVTKDQTEAAALHAALTDAAAQKRLKAGVDFLSEQADKGIVDKARTGVIGWCMGGQQALLLAVADSRIKATAIFYGPLVKDAAELKKLQGPVLGIFGNDDAAPSPADVDAFEKTLKAENIAVEIHRYAGAGHAFASKSAEAMGLYKETQAKDAWEKTWAWLDKTLKPGK